MSLKSTEKKRTVSLSQNYLVLTKNKSVTLIIVVYNQGLCSVKHDVIEYLLECDRNRLQYCMNIFKTLNKKVVK